MTSTPETCQRCGADSDVIDSRPLVSSRLRVRRCKNVICRQRWATYESLIDPDDLPAGMVRRFSVNP